MEKEMMKEVNETVEVMDEVVQETTEIVDVEAVEAEAETEGEVKKDEPKWMSFVIGVRGDAVYEAKTNVDPCLLTDYIEASAGIDMNMVVQLLKSNGIEAVETFFKMKEILVLNSVRLMRENLEATELTEEQYDELRKFFNIDQIETLLETRRAEMLQTQPQEAVEEEKEEEFKIEM